MDILLNAFAQGGWGLLVAVALAYAIKFLYGKLTKRFDELNGKIDGLRDEVTALKVESTTFKTAIRSCGHQDCPTKKLLNIDEK